MRSTKKRRQKESQSTVTEIPEDLEVLESYSLINSSKMKILEMLEKKLSASLFAAEWEVMSNQYNKKQYISFLDLERNLPIIFNWVLAIVDVICAVILLKHYFF